MPSALNLDWSAIAVQAAAGATLEELSEHWGVSINTLKTRSAREGWKATARRIQAEKMGTEEITPSHQSVKPRETNHGLGLLPRLSERSRIRAARIGDATLRTIQNRGKANDENYLVLAPVYKTTVDAMAKTCEWGGANDNRTLVNINLGNVKLPDA